jgi:hypothetical protein
MPGLGSTGLASGGPAVLTCRGPDADHEQNWGILFAVHGVSSAISTRAYSALRVPAS